MTAKVGRVDHPVIAVHDLRKTQEQFKRLGFVVPPIGKHQEWGTENLCIMFPHDYLEIRGIGDPDKFLAGVDEFLKKGEGFYSVAFNAESAEDSYKEGLAAGLSIEPPKHLHRKLELEDKTLDLHFRTVMLGRGLYPGLTHANLCEHRTSDTLRQPGWMDHPNGVVAFERLVGVVADFEEAVEAYTRLIGAANVQREDDRILLHFGDGADIELISVEEAERRGDAQLGLGEDYLASATLRVRDIDVTSALLRDNGIRFTVSEVGKIKVLPVDACGAHLYFQQA